MSRDRRSRPEPRGPARPGPLAPPRPRPGAPREAGPPGSEARRPPRDETEGLLIGRRSVLEALRAGHGLERILLASEGGAGGWFASEASGLAAAANVPVQRIPRVALDRLAPGVVHQGVAARVTDARLATLQDLLATATAPALFVIADGVEDPRNLGAMVRAVTAAGASGLLVPERRTAPLGPACAKASAGTLRIARLARITNVTRTLEDLASEGIWSVGLAAGGRPLWDLDLRRPTCLVIGGEGGGLSRLVRERCDDLAGLPLAPGVESLNASVALGIALYEALRQRRAAPTG